MFAIYVIGCFLVIFLCFYKFLYAPYQLFKRLGIPHPPFKPFIGNITVLDRLGYIEAYEKWIKEYGKVFGYYIGAKPVIVIADLNILQEITVKQFDSFPLRAKIFPLAKEIRIKSGILPEGLLFMKENEWRRIRPTVSPTFSTKKLKAMSPLVEKSCHSLNEVLNEAYVQDRSVDFWKVFGEFTVEVILAAAFGCQSDILKGDENALGTAAAGVCAFSNAKFIHRMSIIFSHFPVAAKLIGIFADNSESIRNYVCIKDFALQLIEQRQENITECAKNIDLLQLLIDARVEETDGSRLSSRQLTNKEIVTLSFDFLLAGSETTSNLLVYTSYLLALNPDVQEKLSQSIKDYYQENEDASLYDAAHEIHYLDWVLHESLRIYPPAPRTTRHSKNTCIVNGITIPENCEVAIPIQHLHCSSEYWDHPEVFRPERFSPEEKEGRHPMCYLPFGSGPRNCVGLRFALMEAKMCLLSILKKYKFERAPDTQVPLKITVGITQSPRDGIFLKVVPCSNS